MKFEDKYISKSEKLNNPLSAKVELSDDSYALCETIDELIKTLKFIHRESK